ncbi:hypothetical protein GJ496_006975 [Pomphorhynchus laevis]|nr:hypothetical protein GJ496_006975 [Pomphorhynchus laevis]
MDLVFKQLLGSCDITILIETFATSPTALNTMYIIENTATQAHRGRSIGGILIGLSNRFASFVRQQSKHVISDDSSNFVTFGCYFEHALSSADIIDEFSTFLPLLRGNKNILIDGDFNALYKIPIPYKLKAIIEYFASLGLVLHHLLTQLTFVLLLLARSIWYFPTFKTNPCV